MSSRRFECTMCADCCRRPGVVEIFADELDRIARFQKTTASELVERHEIEWSEGRWLLHVRDGESCVFLADDRCCIEPVKPRQCRAYPFWPEILDIEGEWERESEACPGIGRGPRLEPAQVEAQRRLVEPDRSES